MEWLIISLLKLARVEAGAIMFRKEDIRVRSIIVHAVQSLRMLADQRMQQIDIHGNEEMTVRADEEWLGEAFINLIKKMHWSTHRLEAKINITLEDNSMFRTVIIQDRGKA
ncbi:hypothetical protein ACFSQ7_32075 [Paenibacillus rhizoplanae]